MTNLRPNVAPDGLYNVTETAKALGIDRHTVARYADQGLIVFKIRKCSRRRVTTGRQIVRIWECMYLGNFKSYMS